MHSICLIKKQENGKYKLILIYTYLLVFTKFEVIENLTENEINNMVLSYCEVFRGYNVPENVCPMVISDSSVVNDF